MEDHHALLLIQVDTTRFWKKTVRTGSTGSPNNDSAYVQIDTGRYIWRGGIGCNYPFPPAFLLDPIAAMKINGNMHLRRPQAILGEIGRRVSVVYGVDEDLYAVHSTSVCCVISNAMRCDAMSLPLISLFIRTLFAFIPYSSMSSRIGKSKDATPAAELLIKS